MGARENLFLRSGLSVRDEAEVLRRLLGLEAIPDTTSAGEDQVGLRGPARTTDGVLGFVVQPNHHVEVDPGPEDIQALDGYTLEIDIWLGRGSAVQEREARLVFDRLVEARAGVPMLLCHDLDLLVAAYLPGRGVYEFAEGTTLDAPDAESWRPWVPEWTAGS